MNPRQVIITLALAGASGLELKRNGIYLEYDFDYQNMDQEIMNAIAAGYDRFYIGFYFSQYGCWSACKTFETLPSRDQVLSDAKAAGAEIILAVGGPTESVEWAINQGQDYIQQFGDNAADYAYTMGFHGIDFGIHLAGDPSVPSSYANNGQLAQYSQTLVASARQRGFNASQIYLSGQAPYFSQQFTNGLQNSLTYQILDKNNDQPWYAGNANLVMFNEGSSYGTFNNMFENNAKYPGSAVGEVVAMGVTLASVGVTKPVIPSLGTVGEGYVDPVTLGQWACNANSTKGWNEGFTGWTWNTQDEYPVLDWPVELT